MFCKNCGAQFEEGQAFCPNCGTKIEAAESVPVNESTPVNEVQESVSSAAPESQPDPQTTPVASNTPINYKAPSFDAPAKKSSKLVPVLIAGVLAIAVLIILFGFLTGGAKRTLKSYMKALKKGNSKKQIECIVPKDAREDYADDAYDLEEDELYEGLDEVYKNFWANLKDEGKVKFEYEIKDIEKLGKLDKLKKDAREKWDIKSIKDFQDEFEDYFDKTYDIDTDDIKKGYVAEIKWDVKVDKKKAAKGTNLVIIYKYKGSWYLFNAPTMSSIVNDLDSDDFKSVIKDYSKDLSDMLK